MCNRQSKHWTFIGRIIVLVFVQTCAQFYLYVCHYFLELGVAMKFNGDQFSKPPNINSYNLNILDIIVFNIKKKLHSCSVLQVFSRFISHLRSIGNLYGNWLPIIENWQLGRSFTLSTQLLITMRRYADLLSYLYFFACCSLLILARIKLVYFASRACFENLHL